MAVPAPAFHGHPANNATSIASSWSTAQHGAAHAHVGGQLGVRPPMFTGSVAAQPRLQHSQSLASPSPPRSPGVRIGNLPSGALSTPSLAAAAAGGGRSGSVSPPALSPPPAPGSSSSRPSG